MEQYKVLRVVGLDISIGATGYCIMDGEKGLKDCGVVKTQPKNFASDMERFDQISMEIFSKIGDHGQDAVFIENYAYAARGHTARIAELTGIIKHDLYCTFGLKPGEQVFVVAPGTLKKYVLGSGVGDKNLVLKYIWKKWGVDIDDDNAGDAYVLARLGVDFLNYTKNDGFTCQHKYEEECVKAIAKQNGVKLGRRKKSEPRRNN